VPQARHFHGLLARGGEIIEALFPGVTTDVGEAGAIYTDAAQGLKWFHHDTWRVRFHSGVQGYLSSRPLLEATVRRHLRNVGNVRLLDGCTVTGLTAAAGGARVTGVRIQRGEGPEETLEADLVVDAAGRGTRAPHWLEELGYGTVPVSTVKVDLAYASRVYRRPVDSPTDWNVLLLYAKPPLRRSGIMARIEGDRWICTLWGYFGDHPPLDDEGYLNFAQTLPMPDIYNLIKDAEPLTPAVIHKFPAHLRRHYEKMDRFPDGLVVLGDAACSFNPIYGQGMTTAALGADALDQCLKALSAGSLTGLSKVFQAKLATLVEMPWSMATSEDFRYPETEGIRPRGLGLVNWYTGRLIRLACRDPQVAQQFLEVQHMLKPASTLFAPANVLKVLTKA
jgi:hypothetical protein